MSFGVIQFTNQGRALQAKAQIGVKLNFTRLAVGDGQLSGQDISDLTALIHEVKSIGLNKFKTLPGGKAIVSGVFTNQDIVTGFWLRELGLFAVDPDVGEILYCYGNAGDLAEYIPSPGGAEILERQMDIVSIVGNAQNVSATIDQSLVYVTKEEFDEALANPEYSLEETFTAQVYSFPSTAVEGQVSDLVLKGNTATNIIKNGNFANGTTGWISSNTLSVVDNTIKVTVSAQYRGIESVPFSASINDKFYYKVKVKSDSNNVGVGILYKGGYAVGSKNHSGSGNFETISSIGTIPENPATGYPIIKIIDSRASNWTEIQAKEVVVINLTKTFGVGNEPDLATCDKIFAHWFDGTKSTGSVRVKSVGKNLFNSPAEYGGISTSNGTTYNSTTIVRSKNYISVLPSTVYRVSSPDLSVSGNVFYYDANKAFLGYGFTNASFTTPANCAFIRIQQNVSSISTGTNTRFQLELGTTVNAYEPYTATEAYTPADLIMRSLLNGTADELDLATGKKTQNVGVKTSVSSGTVINYSDMATGGQFVAYDANGQIIQIGVKGDTLTANAATLNYQLANEVVTYFPPKTLIAKPGGTLYIDFCDADVGLYHNGKIIVEKIDKPIVQMDYVNLINVDTGELIPVDLSKVTVAGDGLSFTIDGAVDGEYYDYGWYYSPELSTLPPVTIKYAVNLKAQVNENTKSISRLDKKIDNVDTVGRARDAYANSQLVELAAAQIVHESLGATLSALGHVKHAVLTATLDTTWTGSSAPYSKTISVSGILATDTPMIDVVMSGTYSTDEARMQAWGYIYRAVTADGSITFYATEKPTVSLPIQIKVVR